MMEVKKSKTSSNSKAKNSGYNHSQIEEKWRKKWEKDRLYQPDLDRAKKPFYNLMMFPYPSAEGLHVGSVFTFTGVDTYGRFKRMQDYDVFEPMGLDGFGIHSENYALKVGRHPKEQAKISQANFYRQMSSIGNSFDWSRKLETYDPNYYKWTQWIFIQLFKNGLAYRKKAPVNFCPSCKTVLSDEQVIDGKCERCSTLVEKRQLEQWFFKITDYAERLLNNIPKLNWTEKVKIAQRDWIGKKEGAFIHFDIKGQKGKYIKVFTTRQDTLYGATFVVVAPEHPLVRVILNSFQDLQIPKQVRNDIEEYVRSVRNKTEIERTAQGKEKNGVFSGLYVINPLNNEELPVWVADYALMGYGTGALFGDAHDDRDVEFAKKYNLPLKPTLITGDKERDKRILSGEELFLGYGTLIHSGQFSGLSSNDALEKVATWLQDHGKGGKTVNYHLRDWLISRQRYWGPPIPMIYCDSCASKKIGYKQIVKSSSIRTVLKKVDLEGQMYGWFPVPEEDLPVLLPDVEDWKPKGDGTSPLANMKDFVNTKCPNCGGKARREADVSDTFLDSSWYFFRYLATERNDIPLPLKDSFFVIADSDPQSPLGRNEMPKQVRHDKEKNISERLRWLPVTIYIGGAEHSVLHLLYSRFITMVFKDLGLIDFEEPYARFYAHGLIIKDGAKMSKSRGNVINPDEYLNKYGVDTVRAYLRFVGPFDMGGDFRDSGIEGMQRFINRVWKLITDSCHPAPDAGSRSGDKEIADRVRNDNIKESEREMHKTIKGITDDLENLHYNTAIAKIMTYYNYLASKKPITKTAAETFVKLIAPFMPFIAEELWEKLGGRYSIHKQPWPSYDPKMLVEDEATIVVTINGKVRDTIKIQISNLKNQNEVEQIARQSDKLKKYLDSKKVKKVIYVPGKIINFVIES